MPRRPTRPAEPASARLARVPGSATPPPRRSDARRHTDRWCPQSLGTCSEINTGTADCPPDRSSDRFRRSRTGQHDGTVPRPHTSSGRTGRPPVTSRAQILAAARRAHRPGRLGEADHPPAGRRDRHRGDDPVPPRAGQGGPAAPAARRVRRSGSASRPARRAAGPHHRGRHRAARCPRRLAVGRRDPYRRRLRRPPRRIGPLDGRDDRGRSHRPRMHAGAGRRCVPQHLVLHRRRDPRPRALRPSTEPAPVDPLARTASSAASTRPACPAWPPSATSGRRWPHRHLSRRRCRPSSTDFSLRPRRQLASRALRRSRRAA